MSYRVLLIDDNQLALESMEKTIPWASMIWSLWGARPMAFRAAR